MLTCVGDQPFCNGPGSFISDVVPSQAKRLEAATKRGFFFITAVRGGVVRLLLCDIVKVTLRSTRHGGCHAGVSSENGGWMCVAL